MSRIGKNPIAIPAGVTVEVKDNVVTVSGKLGKLSQEIQGVSLNIDNNIITVINLTGTKTDSAKHGLYRALINNMIVGVSEGFVKELVSW